MFEISMFNFFIWLLRKLERLPFLIARFFRRLPDRNWILNLAYSFDSDHEIFSGAKKNDQVVSIPLRILQKAKFFDPYSAERKKSVLKKSDEQRKIEEIEILIEIPSRLGEHLSSSKAIWSTFDYTLFS